jgi:hypothetical protein
LSRSHFPQQALGPHLLFGPPAVKCWWSRPCFHDRVPWMMTCSSFPLSNISHQSPSTCQIQDMSLVRTRLILQTGIAGNCAPPALVIPRVILVCIRLFRSRDARRALPVCCLNVLIQTVWGSSVARMTCTLTSATSRTLGPLCSRGRPVCRRCRSHWFRWRRILRA